MARLLQIISLLFLVFFQPQKAVSQVPSQDRIIRFHLWASTESFPGIEAVPDNEIAFAVSKIKEISPFLTSGMVYGWNFDYTPSDKARNVKEYFEFTPIQELTQNEINSIHYAKPWIEDSKLNCWVEFIRSESQISYFKSWQLIQAVKINGKGRAKLSEGFEGIQKACGEAIKNAVRDYERKWIKNKPKEISGKVIMNQPPKIGIEAGHYVVTLDFFMESDRIIEYKTF